MARVLVIRRRRHQTHGEPGRRVPASGLKIELSRSDDSHVHFRHLGFRAEDVDSAHENLVKAGMESREAPHRRGFARMYTSFLKQPGGLEVQLVKYDQPA